MADQSAGCTWPESDAVYAWAKEHAPNIENPVLFKLAEEVTKYRITVQEDRAKALADIERLSEQVQSLLQEREESQVEIQRLELDLLEARTRRDNRVNRDLFERACDERSDFRLDRDEARADLKRLRSDLSAKLKRAYKGLRWILRKIETERGLINDVMRQELAQKIHELLAEET